MGSNPTPPTSMEQRKPTASETLKTKFGDKLRFEILEQSGQGRTSRWLDADGTVRALSAVAFVDEGARAFPELHAAIRSGRPIGETFVAAGVPFRREEKTEETDNGKVITVDVFVGPQEAHYAHIVETYAK